MREWSERHIRELIRNEIIRLGGAGGDGDKPPLPYHDYWPGPVDLVTGGKHALFSACLTSQAGAIWPSCWIEFLGIDYIREGTTDTGHWFRLYWRQNAATQDGEYIMTIGIPSCAEVANLQWGAGDDLYPIWSQQHHLWRWRQGDFMAAGPVASIYIDRLQTMINDNAPDNTIVRAINSLQGAKTITTMKLNGQDAISNIMVAGETIDLISVGSVGIGLHYIDCYY